MNINHIIMMSFLITAPVIASENNSLEPKQTEQQQPSPEDIQYNQQKALIDQLLKGSPEEQQLALFFTDPENNQPPQIYSVLRDVYFDLLTQGVIKGTLEEENLAQNYFDARKEIQSLNKDTSDIEQQIKTDKNVRIACQAFNLWWRYHKGEFSFRENTFDDQNTLQPTINTWSEQSTAASKKRSEVESIFKTMGRADILWDLLKNRVLFPKLRTTSYASWEPLAGSVLNVATSLVKDQVTPKDQMLMSKAAKAGMADPFATLVKTGLDWFNAHEGHQKYTRDKQSALDEILKGKKALIASAKEAKAAIFENLDQNPQRLIPHLSTLVNVMVRNQQNQK